MKFAFVVTNLAGGGAEKAVLKIATALQARGNEVHLVLLEHVIEHALADGLPIHVVQPTGQPVSKGWLGKQLTARRLRSHVQALRADRPFDLIVSTLPFADEVAVSADLPRHCCRIANTLSAEIDRLRTTDSRKAERRLRRYRDLYRSRPLIAVSQGVMDDLQTRFGIAAQRIHCVPNPFDFAAIRAQALEAAALPAQPYVIHVGRFAGQKRHDLLLDAWQQLTVPHRLVLLTRPEPALAQLIAARGLNERVIVAGFQANPYPWIKRASLLVLASDHEGLPNVIIEAIALGTPIVSTDCPSGPREILGTALPQQLVPTGDATALAHAIARSLHSPPDVGRVDLSRYSVDTVAAAYERIAREGA